MKKAILFTILFTCFLGAANAQKTTIYCTVFYGMTGSAPDFGVTEDSISIEARERIKTNLKKKKTYASVITTMSAEGWDYVDTLILELDFNNKSTYLLFKLRD